MKILHLCLASFYIDNFSYQENLLPKYHKKMGLDVEIIASLIAFDKNGKGFFEKKGRSYTNENGIPVTRLEYKQIPFSKTLRIYNGTYDTIKKSNPDIIFIHGCQFMDMLEVVKYLKENPNVKTYVDNHADFSNSATNILSKNILHKIIWKYCAKIIEPFTTKFYGVLPARVDFLKDIYKLPPNKIDLLVMGAEDEKILHSEEYNQIRKKYNIESKDFLIVTGGKIDLAKKQTLHLMKAVRNLNNINIKLLFFGSVIEELKDEVNSLIDDNLIKYAGWINSDDSYDYFAAADLVVFPGRHSVFWEQVVAQGKPLIVKDWEGTRHIDLGNNCKFLLEDTYEELYEVIKKIVTDENEYSLMKKSALSKKRNDFLYTSIARKSIDDYLL